MTNPETYDKISKSSGNGHEKNMGVFPSGQWGQTVNLLLFSFGGSNPPAPTKEKRLRTQVFGRFSFCHNPLSNPLFNVQIPKRWRKMRYSIDRLRKIEENLRVINQNIEYIQSHGPNDYTLEIAQLCTDLQHTTEEMRSILASAK